MKKVEFYTDGAFSAIRNAGGIGVVVVIDGQKVYEYSHTYYDTTNNKCELLAVITALNSISKPVESVTIYSDSQYVIMCAQGKWKRKANLELWATYDKVFAKAQKFCTNIEYTWVKGHSKASDDFNENMNKIADKLAVEASHVLR